MADNLLVVDGVAASIGSYEILHDVSLSVREQATTVLLGRNGAGKTTTLRTIMGFVRPSQGSVTYRGDSIARQAPHRVARRGIAYVPEDRGMFPDLTVAENLRVANPKTDSWPQVFELFPILKDRLGSAAGQLSGGQQQMLTVARALLQEPALLLLDEPSKGLAPLVIEEMMEALRGLRQETTILLVEQNLDAARKLGDDFVVLDDGRTVAQGSMSDMAAQEDAIERFLTVSVSTTH